MEKQNLTYWQLSNGDTWELLPMGNGLFRASNTAEGSKVAWDKAKEQLRELAEKYLGVTIVEEL